MKQASPITEPEDYHNWPQSTHKITTDVLLLSLVLYDPRIMKDRWSQLHPLQKFNSVLFTVITQIPQNHSITGYSLLTNGNKL